jgi:hypothetical protein
VTIVPTDKFGIDTFLITTLNFTINLDLTKSLSYVSQPYTVNVINICDKETMNPKSSEFLYVVQKNKKDNGEPVMVLNDTEVPDMFDANFDVKCVVKSWYVADEGLTAQIDITHDTAIRMLQVDRTEDIDSIKVNTTQGLTDHTIKFRL